MSVLKTLPDNSVDSIVTDPMYGLSFMGKKWDYDVPDKKIWKQCLRVLKHGGHLLAFSGTRTYHRMVVNIEDAGFEIRDCIQWLYGSGFPKSHDIGKAIDKAAGVEVSNDEWDGWGTALKPANEPICLARKPLIGTVVENILEHGTGGINIDDCRVATNDEPRVGNTDMSDCEQVAFGKGWQKSGTTPPEGRFPANVIMDEERGYLRRASPK